MNTPNDDQTAGSERLTQRSRELFDAGVTGLDAHTRSRLNQARQAALDAARGRTVTPMRWWVPAGSVAAVGLVTLLAVQFMRSGEQNPAVEATPVVASSVEDLEIVTSGTDLDMLRDMEFYAWLETEGTLDEVASGEAG